MGSKNTAQLEMAVRRILATTPGCCRHNALMQLADQLRVQGQPAEADQLNSIVARLVKTTTNKAVGPTSQHIPGAPRSADQYYESCVRKYKATRDDWKSHCVEVARRLVCTHVDPNHPWCRENR